VYKDEYLDCRIEKKMMEHFALQRITNDRSQQIVASFIFHDFYHRRFNTSHKNGVSSDTGSV
jgi:hypothetical protein